MTNPLPDEFWKALGDVDTPTVCNALDLAAGTRDHAVTQIQVHPALDSRKSFCGFAATARIKARTPPADAEAAQRNRLAYYEYVAGAPRPSLLVIEDEDHPEGGGDGSLGAWWGEVHSAVHAGLGLEGCLTNGLVRDLDALTRGFQILSGGVGVTHANVHVTALNEPVRVFGLEVRPGDLVHADIHGAVVIPPDVVVEIPRALQAVRRREAPMLEAARSPDFDFAALRAALERAAQVS